MAASTYASQHSKGKSKDSPEKLAAYSSVEEVFSPTLSRAFNTGKLNSAQRISYVQQTAHKYGNQQLQRMLRTKQEAKPEIQRSCDCGGKCADCKSKSEAPAVESKEIARREQGPVLQRACACDASAPVQQEEKGVQRAPTATAPSQTNPAAQPTIPGLPPGLTQEQAKNDLDQLLQGISQFLAQSQSQSAAPAAASGGPGLVNAPGDSVGGIGSLTRENDKLVDRGTPDWVVSYKPQAILRPLGNGPAQQKDFATDPNRDSFNLVRGNNGILTLSADIHWERTSQNGGGGGGGGGKTAPTGILGTLCDIGTIATIIIPVASQTVKLLCKAADAKERAKIIDSLTDAQLCALMAALGALSGSVIPILGTIFGGLGSTAVCGVLSFLGVGDSIRNKLKELFGVDPGKGGGNTPPTPVTIVDKGDARAFLETRFSFGADGQLQLLGTPPTGQSRGKAGELINPVQFSRDTSPTGALISIVPLLHSSISSTRANGETVPDINDFQQSFAIDLLVPPAPAPIVFCCSKQLFPFIVAKERFEREDEKQQELFNWFEALSPKVRKSIQDKQTRVTVIGRASNTGSKEFNLGLAERRAKHVSQMMSDFGGSEARIDSFAFGRLTAKAPGENGFERRAEVIAKGEIPASDPNQPDLTPPCGTNVPDEGGICSDPATL